jgi:hypothetical protein
MPFCAAAAHFGCSARRARAARCTASPWGGWAAGRSACAPRHRWAVLRRRAGALCGVCLCVLCEPALEPCEAVLRVEFSCPCRGVYASFVVPRKTRRSQTIRRTASKPSIMLISPRYHPRPTESRGARAHAAQGSSTPESQRLQRLTRPGGPAPALPEAQSVRRVRLARRAAAAERRRGVQRVAVGGGRARAAVDGAARRRRAGSGDGHQRRRARAALLLVALEALRAVVPLGAPAALARRRDLAAELRHACARRVGYRGTGR